MPTRPAPGCVPGAAPLPRVLYALALTPGHKLGSIEEQILVLAEAFRAEGSLLLPLFICESTTGNVDLYRERGVPAECLDLRRFDWRGLGALLRLLSTHRIDVIHWHFTSPLGNAYVWWLTLLRPGVRHYFTDHISRLPPMPAPPRGPRRWLKRLLFHRYARVICVSQFVRNYLNDQAVGPNRLLACLHFVNTDRFRPNDVTRHRLRRELAAEGRFVLLAVGQLIEAKGIHVLVQALARLPCEAMLWIIGEGAGRPALEALIVKLGLANRVKILGHQFDVCPFMQAADCFVCPSLWAEAAGLVNLEAAACGLPVIASRTGGIPEYLDDGRTGLLFTAGDTAALTDCLNRLISDSELHRRLAEQGRALAEQRFSIKARLADTLEIYRK